MALQLISWLIIIVVPVGIYYFLTGPGKKYQRLIYGWDHLNRSFAAGQMPAAYDLTSGTIGMARYRNTLRIAFADAGVYLMPGIGLNPRPQLIPYQAFVLDADSQYLTQGIYQYVHFVVGGVDIGLDKDVAQRILRHNQQTLPPDRR